MEFGFSPAETAFAEEVRGFLREQPLERFPVDGMDAGYGSGAHSRAFMKALAERGWISMCWPVAYGGQERPMFFKLVLFEELALAGAPFGPLAGSWQTADAIIEYGSERLRREVLPAVARGEATFWQGYSEPDAGSDLLALKTEARCAGGWPPWPPRSPRCACSSTARRACCATARPSATRRRSPRSTPTRRVRSSRGSAWTCSARGRRCARARERCAWTARSRTRT